MANFDFSSFLKSIAPPPLATVPPEPPRSDLDSEIDRKSTSLPMNNQSFGGGEVESGGPTAGEFPAVQSGSGSESGSVSGAGENGQGGRAGMAMGMGMDENGVGTSGIGKRLGIEAKVRVDSANWGWDGGAGLPQLPVRTVSTMKDPLVERKTPMNQVAVNKRFVCYGLRKGDIRVLAHTTSERILIRHHSASISDMKFLSYEEDWLLTAGLDHRIVVQELKLDMSGIQHKILLQVQLQVPPPLPPESLVRTVWAPNFDRFIIFAVHEAVYLCSIERALCGRHIRTVAGSLGELEWDSGAVVALKVGENNAAFGALCKYGGWGAVNVLTVNKEEGLVAAGSNGGVIRVWKLLGDTLFPFLDEEQQIAPLMEFNPAEEGSPLQYIGWCGGGGSSCMLTVTGPKPFQCLKLWKQESCVTPGGPLGVEVQSLEVTGQKGEGSCSVVIANESKLILLADNGHPNLVAIHYTEDATGRLMFESHAAFHVKRPILSMALEGKGLQGNERFDLFCVQSDVVQLYSIDPEVCLPCQQGTDETGLSDEGYAACLDSGDGGGKLDQTDQSLEDQLDHPPNGMSNVVEVPSTSPSEIGPTGDELRAVSAAVPSLFGGRFAEAMKTPPHPFSMSAPVPAVRGVINPHSSSNPGSIDVDRDGRSSTMHAQPVDVTATGAGPLAVQSAVQFAVQPMSQLSQGVDPCSVEPPTEPEVQNPAGGTVPPASESAASSRAADGTVFNPIFGSEAVDKLVTDQKRTIQVLEHKLGRAFHSLNKKLDSGFEEQKGRMADGPGMWMQIEPKMNEFAGRALEGMTNAAQKSVQDEMRASIRSTLGSAMHKGFQQMGNGLQQCVENVVASELPKCLDSVLQESFRDSFHAVIIPAFESAVQNMFSQVQTALSTGLSEHLDTSRVLNASIQQNITNMASNSDKFRDEIVELKTHVKELKQQIEVLHKEVGASREVPSTPHLSRGSPAQGSTSSSDFLMTEVASLIKMGDFDEAFNKALSLSRIDVTNWMISKVDHRQLFNTVPCPLRQEVLLSLLNQLGCDMLHNTALKLEWVKGVTAHLDTTPLSPRRAELMNGVLDHLIATIQGIIASHGLSGVASVNARMAVNMLLGLRSS